MQSNTSSKPYFNSCQFGMIKNLIERKRKLKVDNITGDCDKVVQAQTNLQVPISHRQYIPQIVKGTNNDGRSSQ